MNTVEFMSIVALIATLILTVMAYKFIIPENKRIGLNKLGQFLHDVFNFKFLIVEKLLQFFYVLATIGCVCFGLCMLLGFESYHSYYYDETYTTWYGFYGILIAVLGPIVLRLSYEFVMMGVLLVKNVIHINKKLKSQVEEDDEYKMPRFKELVAKENFDFITNKFNKQN